MATYQSSSNTAPVVGDTLVISKPSGLAVGDLMIAVIGIGATATISSSPSGWTNIIGLADTNISAHSYQKIATSGDVAASNFTWVCSTASSKIYGGIIRISDPSSGNPVGASNLQLQAAISSGGGIAPITYPTGVTPLNTNELLIFMSTLSHSATTSNYAIATSNPSWTELFDITDVGASMGVAYANRTQSTSTGAYSVDVLLNGTGDAIGILLSINESKDTVVSDSTTLTDSAIYGLAMFVSDVVTLVEPIITALVTKWRNLLKSVTTWINQNKP